MRIVRTATPQGKERRVRVMTGPQELIGGKRKVSKECFQVGVGRTEGTKSPMNRPTEKLNPSGERKKVKLELYHKTSKR